MAKETFGPCGSDFRLLARANDELAELIRALGGTEPCPDCNGLGTLPNGTGGMPCPCGGSYADALAEEATDVLIVLARRHQVDVFAHAGTAYPDVPDARMMQIVAARAAVSIGRLLFDAATACDHLQQHYITPVAVAMWAIGRRFGRDMGAEVDLKMAINRARTWKVDPAGRGYHVHARAAVEPLTERAYRMSVDAAAREAAEARAEAEAMAKAEAERREAGRAWCGGWGS